MNEERVRRRARPVGDRQGSIGVKLDAGGRFVGLQRGKQPWYVRHLVVLEGRETTMHDTETGTLTGTADKDYNIIWFTEACLSNVLRLESYIADAERADDPELAEFFRRAQGDSRKGAEQGKQLLARRLAS